MYKVIKRAFDILFSLIGLLIFSIPVCIFALIVKAEDPGPAFFVQQRVGMNKKLFNLYKLRSMKMSAPKNVPTHLLGNPGQYLLKSGRFFRKFSIDELPQLLNILKGDMSLVGPRPALFNQYDLIAERDKCGANSVRPGLTGWAQINGRDEISLDEKVRLDGEYVKKRSFSFDCQCLFKTLFKVFSADGVKDADVPKK